MTAHTNAISRDSYTVSDLAQRTSGRVIGDGELRINRVAQLKSADPGEIAYVADEKFFETARQSQASCLIVSEGAQLDFPCRIEVKNPNLAFAQIAEVLHPPKKREGKLGILNFDATRKIPSLPSHRSQRSSIRRRSAPRKSILHQCSLLTRKSAKRSSSVRLSASAKILQSVIARRFAPARKSEMA